MNEDELADLLDEGAGPRARWGRRGDAATRAAAEHVRALLGDEAVWAEPDPDGADAFLAAVRQEQAELDELANGRGERRWVPRAARRPAPSRASRSSQSRPSGPWAAIGHTGQRLERRFGAARVRLAAVAAVVLVLGLGVVGGMALGEEGGEQESWDATGTEELALGGTERAPDASAVVHWDDTPSGVEVWLASDGLGPAPEGSYYEAWASGPDGRVSLGTFHLRGGDDPVVLWSGVPLDRYPTLTVTVQREGADPGPSRDVVLEGDVTAGG
jgi:hypothetical protein